jgi:hypothetical protein
MTTVIDPLPGSPESRDEASKPFSFHERGPGAPPGDGRSLWDTRGEPPIEDPFLHPAAPRAKARTPWLAVVAITSTALLFATTVTGAWLWHSGFLAAPTAPESQPSAPDVPDFPPPRAHAPTAVVPSPPLAPAPAADAAPRQTKVSQVGKITVVDLGVESRRTLSEDLAEQRLQAQSAGQTLVLMTTRFGIKEFRDVDASLPDPLLQAALANVRLVRVDIAYYDDELEKLGIPTNAVPWFILFAPDLTPRDGIDGGEWDDDIPRNIAPVLGPFVKGTYKTRRHQWKPPPSKGVQL